MGSALRALRLAIRMQRLEVLLLVGATVLVVTACLAIAWQTRVVRAEQLACYRNAPAVEEGSLGSPCHAQDATLQTLEQAAAFAKVGVIGVPILLGLFLGVPLVAREIEGRTAPLAWSLSRSRGRWFLLRAGPVVAIVGLSALALGIAGDVLTHAAPWVEGSGPGFEDWFSRGPQVAVRALALLGVGALAGALVGRQLAAVLLGAAATLAIFVSATLVMDGWMRDAAEPVPIGPTQIVSGKIYGSAFRDDATGEVLDDQEAYERYGDQLDEFGMAEGLTMMYYMVPSQRFGEFVLREAGLFGAVALLTAAGSLWLVVTRRP
jgi:hypothetical protein